MDGIWVQIIGLAISAIGGVTSIVISFHKIKAEVSKSLVKIDNNYKQIEAHDKKIEFFYGAVNEIKVGFSALSQEVRSIRTDFSSKLNAISEEVKALRQETLDLSKQISYQEGILERNKPKRH